MAYAQDASTANKPETKVKDLTPHSKQVNVVAKCLSVGEAREIPSKFGPTRRVAEAVVGDETATIILSLWENQIGTVNADDVIFVDNGFVSLVRGHMRLNSGKYGSISRSDRDIPTVETSQDMSAKEYAQERRFGHEGGRRDFGGRGGGYGGGSRYGGRRDRDDRSGSSDQPRYMQKGRRRF